MEKNTSLKKAQQFGFLNLWRINSGTILADDVKIWNAADYNILSDTDRAFVCNEYLSPLNSFNGGDKIYVAARVENNTDNNENATIAEYESGCPITVKLSDTISILPGKADIIKLSYTIPNDIENKQIKAFLWKDVSSLVPIAEHTNIN